MTVIATTLASHRLSPFAALVVIRGGGSVTDLAWLNDLQLATLLCLSPIPVFTGIGHERDITILDDIAHTRFDTPSKVALHIVTTIKDNAVATMTSREAAMRHASFQVFFLRTGVRYSGMPFRSMALHPNLNAFSNSRPAPRAS
jgi:exonuclease VII large subunit